MAHNEHVKMLRRSVFAWNDWRKQQPEVYLDLWGADLGGATLSGARLSKANLWGADLSGATKSIPIPIEAPDLSIPNADQTPANQSPFPSMLPLIIPNPFVAPGPSKAITSLPYVQS